MIPMVMTFALFAVAAGASTGALRIVAAVVGVGAICAAGMRAFRIGLWASPERICIRNYWRSYDVAWSDVIDVSSEPDFRSARGGWRFKLRDGHKILLLARPRGRRSFGESHRLVSVSKTPVKLREETLDPPDDV